MHRSDDRGSAMLVAIGSLLVMSLLAALSLQAATASSDGSNTDARAKYALQAAESGLQTATYRLNMRQPTPDRCVTQELAIPTGGACAASPSEALGNGAWFSYRTTPALGASDTCAGLSIRTQTALTQRCVTSSGTVDGVTRRLQARVAAYASTPLFPVAGILGLKSVGLNGNVQIPDTVVATNGNLTVNGNVATNGAVLGPNAPKPSINGNTDVEVRKRTPADGDFVLGGVDPGSSATVNDDQRIANGLQATPVAPYDPVSGASGLSYDAATRTLRASGNATITLGGGVYNFCGVSIRGNFTLNVATGAKVAVYIDSPDDPNSGCPAGSGGFSVGGNFSSGSAKGTTVTSPPLQLYVYGTNDHLGTVSLAGNATLHAAIYAPQSTVSLSGNVTVFGAIAALAVSMNGNGFQYDGQTSTLQTGSTGLYYRTAWRQCPATAGPGGPATC